jgi:hypothetical protein
MILNQAWIVRGGKMIQITDWEVPEKLIKTVHGKILYAEWVVKEQARLLPDRQHEIRTQSLPNMPVKMALFANPLCIVRGCRQTAEHHIYCEGHKWYVQKAYDFECPPDDFLKDEVG